MLVLFLILLNAITILKKKQTENIQNNLSLCQRQKLYGQNEIKPYIRGAVTKTITKDDAKKIRIPVPPITLQNNFENFVQQIDKSKFAVQKLLKKTEILYKSLMCKLISVRIM